jgi:hypothetical protein
MSKEKSYKKIKDNAVSKWAGIIGNIPASVEDESVPSKEWGDIAFPLVKRVFAKTVGLDMVSVVPMSSPSGNLFYGDPVGPQPPPPLEILKKAIELWRADRANEILENRVRRCLDTAIPGLSNQTIERAMEDDAFMDELVKINSIASEYGI